MAATESSGVLTREMLENFFKACEADAQLPEREPVYHCHPLEYPFYQEIFNGNGAHLDTVIGWKYECFRKYRMGQKRHIEKWSMKNLIAQYTGKIETLKRRTHER